MRIPRIFTPQNLTAGSSVELEPSARAHVARALRMSEGDRIVLFNGEGGEFLAELQSVGKNQVIATLGESRSADLESPLAIHLGIAVSRGDRMDWVVQKATELGVRQISPLFTERTEVKLKGQRADKRLLHWRQVAISACEQSGRNRLPTLNPLMDLQAWVQATRADCKFVLHHRAVTPEPTSPDPATVALLIGPEGGLSETEIATAECAGFSALALGPRVLRTETAPLASIAILQARWGDMSTGWPG